MALEDAPKSQPAAQPPVMKPVIPPVIKTNTTEITAKPTSPTLVEFQNKNAMLPEWRLQVQNAVRKRVEGVSTVSATIETKPTTVSRVHLPTSGANALKAEVIAETEPVRNSNPKLANALKRIEASRKRFLPEETENAPKVPPTPTAQNKNYPFYIATKNAEVLPKPAEMQPAPVAAPPVVAPSQPPVAPAMPKLEDLPVIEKKAYDTNKLKPLPNASIISTTLEKVSDEILEIDEKAKDAPLIKISRVITDEDEEILEIEDAEFVEETQEGEDLAPFAMRFNAGLFDLIIGGFTSLIMFSAALMISGGKWISLPGLLAFLVTFAVVMFVYLTTSIGMFGKTVGMKIFSLETIDIEENDYPTFHQAAVSSSVYLVSLALGGIGFLPALFNSERRTAPDLLSGTIVVKEY
jgi:uncharacterized RDD family membrane protein YckC